MKIDGVWGLGHILSFIAFLLLASLGIFLIHRYVKNKKTYDLIVLISAIILLISVSLNRFFSVYESIILHQVTWCTNWWQILPSTICALTSFLLSICVFFLNRNHHIFHYLIYIATFGCIVTWVYPSYLNDQVFVSGSSITSFLYHGVMSWMVILFFMGGFIPSIKKWYMFPLGYAFYVLVGFFEYQVMGYPNPMNVVNGLSSDFPYVTSWYVLWPFTTLCVLIFLFIYERVKNGKKFKITLREMFFIS